MRADAVLRLAWRESRFARRRLLLFLSAISLGVAALVAVEGFASAVARGIRAEARALLGADLALGSRQPFGPRTEALLDSLRAAGHPVARRTSFASMARLERTGAVRLAQVRAPEPGYPFYGEVTTRPAGAWERLHAGRHAVVDPALLSALGARVGDSLSLGETRFRILGTLEKVPGDVDIASAFAPRLIIPARYLEETGLLGFGSRVEHEAFVRLPRPELADQLGEAYRVVLRRERAGVDTVAEEQEELEETLGQMTAFLGLLGVLALLLGGIGVASAMQAYMARKTEAVAVLRCLGATARQVLAVYLAQAALMGLVGAALGVALGLGVQTVLPRLLAGMLPVEAEVGVEGGAVLLGLAVGVGAAMLSAALPLLGIRRVSPLGALRRGVEPLRVPGRDPARWLAGGALVLGVSALVVLQLREPRLGAGVVGGIAGALAALWAAAWLAMRLVRGTPRAALAYVARQGLSNLYRPGNQTRTVVLALGCGVFLLATLLLTQHNLLLPLRGPDATRRANLVLWDVQEDQRPGVERVLGTQGRPVVQRAPIVPMRVAAVNGVEVRPWGEDAVAAEPAEGEAPDGWAVRREYRSTYRDSLVGSERLVEGEFWGAGAAAGQVSLEREIAEELGVEIGDTLVWDVQGVRLPTVVSSVREVDWARFEPNFFAVFPTRALEGAPKSWVILTRAPTAAARAELQSAVVEQYPNVSLIDLTLVQEALDEVVGRVAAAVRFLAVFSIATGFVVLLGAISTSRLQRMRESVLLKTLGATRRQIAGILLSEYLLLGLLAVIVGTGLALAAGWALARWVFEVDFELTPLPLAALAAAVALLVATVGLWASREVFRRTPLEALRNE